MSLKTLQTLRRSVFAVCAHRDLYPEVASEPVPAGRENDILFTTVVIGTAFLADASGIYLTAGHVVQGLVSRLEKMLPRFQAGELSLNFRRPILFIQVQHVRFDDLPAEIRPDSDGAAVIPGFYGAASAYMLDEAHDLAAIYTKKRVPMGNGRDFDPIPLAFAPGEASLGDEVVACGYPFGSKLNRIWGTVMGNPPTISRGIIGAILPEWSAPLPMRAVFRFDATVLPGNSGGPVCDLRSGKLVGVVSTVTVTRVQHLDHSSQRTESTVPVGFPQAVPLFHVREFLKRAREGSSGATDFVTGGPVTPPLG